MCNITWSVHSELSSPVLRFVVRAVCVLSQSFSSLSACRSPPARCALPSGSCWRGHSAPDALGASSEFQQSDTVRGECRVLIPHLCLSCPLRDLHSRANHRPKFSFRVSQWRCFFPYLLNMCMLCSHHALHAMETGQGLKTRVNDTLQYYCQSALHPAHARPRCTVVHSAAQHRSISTVFFLRGFQIQTRLVLVVQNAYTDLYVLYL